jgi:hypothetical protein
MTPSGPRPPVGLEDLLRLKRAEQPSPQFWTDFERELRVKQLAAMVEKRPWWCAFPRVYSFVLRQRAPLAAAAAAAAMGLGVYGLHRTAVVPAAAPASADGFAAAPAARPISTEVAAAPAPRLALERAVAAAAPKPEASPAGAGELAQAQSLAPASAIPVLENVPQGELAQRFDPTLGRTFSADLTAVQVASGFPARSLASLPRGWAGRYPAAATPAAEPLAQMPSPGTEQRARLLAEAVPAVDRPNDLSMPTDDRLELSRLSEDSVLARTTVSRYDLAAERELQDTSAIKFSIKF